MSMLNNRSKVIVEKDYTEQLIFSDKLPATVKTRVYIIVVGLMFGLLSFNIILSLKNNLMLERIFGL